jgi:alpha-glucosidase
MAKTGFSSPHRFGNNKWQMLNAQCSVNRDPEISVTPAPLPKRERKNRAPLDPSRSHFMRIFRFLLAILVGGGLEASVVGLGAAAPTIPQRVTVASPNGQLVLSFFTTPAEAPKAAGRLVYTVSFHGKSLVDASGLELDLDGQAPLGRAVCLAKLTATPIDSEYHLVTGKTSTARDYCNAVRVELEESVEPHRRLAVEGRAYDDAVAFRYVVPEQPALKEFRLAKERSEFRISKDATAYALELPNYRSMYESEFIKLPISALANQGGVPSTILVGLPLLMDVPGVAWLAITEADLRDYSSMYLVNPAGNWSGHWFESRLAPQVDNTNLAVTGALPHASAWRVLLVASEPGKLIESTAITSLNPRCALEDISWIHAGKTAWNWWSGSIGPEGKPAYNTATMKYYVDFAARSGFPYMLVDAGWSRRGDITRMNGRVDIPELVRYAAAKQVRIWIWLGYRETNRQMEQAFALYEKWGVAGVKIDFVERDDQAGIDFYYRAAGTAARHHLMVDFHGATKPSGIDRTYPNILGYEAVAGMEQSKGGARDNPDHHLMLPFTRMLAGRMDYTPGGFDNVTREEFEPRSIRPRVMGTRAHQLAMYVVYEEPFQMVSDCPAAYENQPAFDFIKAVPATWDETRVQAGTPGDYIVLARRSGRDWFLGAMSNWFPRRLNISLAFLGQGRYQAEIYADAPDAYRFPKQVVIQRRVVTRDTTLAAGLAPGGGYAARFTPLD